MKAFADKVVKGARENPQRYSDVAALAMVANYAAAMTGDPGQFVDDMGAVLAGVTHETLLDEGLPLSPDFGQTGFRPEFQEPQFGPRNNQVRHFIGFVVAGYEWGAPGASVVNAGRELWDTMRGYSSGTWPDVRLGNAGADLGWRIRLGEIAPKEVGDWIQRNIANTTP